MDDEELTNLISVLLAQTRFARRSLEDIERATASYGTFAFTSVISAGKRFGEPPLVDGALKVYVVNINDLAPGGGFGALLEGLLAGAGSFAGNLVGGVVGGTLSSMQLVAALPTINQIAGKVERILSLLGIGGKGQAITPSPGSTLVTKLESIQRAVNALTGLFLAAAGQTERAAGVSELPSTPEGERWRRLMESASLTLASMSRVVDGLIIALPMVIGFIASLISRLPTIRTEIAETLRFILRNALLLRGALLVTLLDTLTVVVRVAAQAVGILARTLSDMLSTVFVTIREALLAVLVIGATVGEAVKSTIDALLGWLVPTIDIVLRNLGNLPVFRVLTHVVRILPAILPPIYELKFDKPMLDTSALDRAARLAIPGSGPAGGGRPVLPPAAPDFGAIINNPVITRRLTSAIGALGTVAENGVTVMATSAQEGLNTLGTELDRVARDESRLSDTRLGGHLDQVAQQSNALAERLVVDPAASPRTGLEAIATAYEKWISGTGLSTLLTRITSHFQSTEGLRGIPSRVVEGAADQHRATIQIDEVVIEVIRPAAETPLPPGSVSPPGDYPLPQAGDEFERLARAEAWYGRRGGQLRTPRPLVQPSGA
jgi:hypothetical protein